MSDSRSSQSAESGDSMPSILSEREFYALSRTPSGYALVIEKGLSVSDFREAVLALPDGPTLMGVEFVSEDDGAMEFVTLTFQG